MPTQIHNDMELIRELMSNAYLLPHTDYNKSRVESCSLEKEGFLLKEDAEKIQEICKKNNYKVIFRNAGEATLRRIRAKHPCKGHDIESKTVKEKDNGFTYAELTKTEQEKFLGLVGYPTDNLSQGTPTLHGFWYLDGKKNVRISKDKYDEKTQIYIYTGDYDMQDLFLNNRRVMAGTQDENRFLHAVNVELRSKWKIWSEYSMHYSNQKDNPFSPIRHGAQSSFISYLIGTGDKELPKIVKSFNEWIIPKGNKKVLLDKLMNETVQIECDEKHHLCAIDNSGMYIFTSVKELYSYYFYKDLEKEVPYYYFLKSLSETYSGKYEHLKKIEDAKKHISELLLKLTQIRCDN